MLREIFLADVVFAVAIGFLTGTLAAGLGCSPFIVAFIVVILLGLASIIMRPIFHSRIRLVFAFAFPVGLLVGSLYYYLVAGLHAGALTRMPLGKSTMLSAVITDEPSEVKKYLMMPASLETPFSGAITIFASQGSDIRYGDVIKFEAVLEPPRTVGDTPAAFPKKISVVATGRGALWREAAIAFSEEIAKKFLAFLPGDAAALLFGETIGGTREMNIDLKTNLAASGTSYVVSMYGYKISLIIFSLEALLAEILERRIRFAVIIAAVFIFVLVVGGSLSAVRAAIMVVFTMIGKLLGRTSEPHNALALTAVGMALFDPTLPSQAAFELTILSVAGMAYLATPLKNFFRWGAYGAGFLGWREAVIVAIASLLPIIPIAAVVFGDFSLVSFPSNILIAIAIPPAALFGIALASAGSIPFFAGYVGFFIAKLAFILLSYQLFVINIFAAIAPCFLLPPQLNSMVVFAGYYIALLWFAYRYRARTFN